MAGQVRANRSARPTPWLICSYPSVSFVGLSLYRSIGSQSAADDPLLPHPKKRDTHEATETDGVGGGVARSVVDGGVHRILPYPCLDVKYFPSMTLNAEYVCRTTVKLWTRN